MERFRTFLAPCLILLVAAGAAYGEESDPFAFFDAEAEVVTASLRPQPLRLAPATVHVVTGDEIRSLGVQTLWDALRGVPGVDVMATRTSHGEVSIRGLNKPLNNRTLVLVDGRTVLNGYFDFVTWEGINVPVEEVDRIEIVEGPVSSLHGANAINGVINIITKTPEQIEGGILSYSVGENGARLGTLLLGRRTERLAVKSSMSIRAVNRFDLPGTYASEVAKFSGLARFHISPQSTVSLSGGVVDLDTQLSAGIIGTAYEKGPRGFIRGDFESGNTQVRAFWNRGRTRAENLFSLGDPDLYFDTYDLNLQHAVFSGTKNALTMGASARRNTMRSHIFGPGTKAQNLWAFFLEDRWSVHPKLDLLLSGRLDHHPLAGAVVSPRTSAIYSPSPEHGFRFSVGTAFRNPTLAENYLQFSQARPNPGTSVPNPPYSQIDLVVIGNQDLAPERLLHFELGHSGNFKRLQTGLVGFHYRLADVVSTESAQDPSAPPVFKNIQTFINHGEIAGWGGEARAELWLNNQLSTLFNVSYQTLEGVSGIMESAYSAPKTKVNAGIRYRTSGLAAHMMLHHVGSTQWPLALDAEYPNGYGQVDAYTFLNMNLSYAFSGSLQGVQFGISASNATNHRHYEILPTTGPATPGQGGEILGRRVLANVTYSFR